MTTLDVVIVNWNAGNQLLDCLQSLQISCRTSAFHLSKCIVVDNASTDGSADYLKDASLPLVLIKNPENKGFAYASNVGAKVGESGYILFLNPDVRLSPDSLTKSLLFLEEPRNERAGILGIQLIDDDGRVQRNAARFPTPTSFFYQMLGFDRLWPKRFPPLIMTDWDHQESKELDHVQGSFFLVRRRVFEELHGFDERFFMYYEDLDFTFRAKQAGWKVYYLSSAQAFHQGGGTSYQIKIKRLFYSLCSRVHYVAKHFGMRAAWSAIIVSIGVEFWIRLGWSLINFTGLSFIETIQAYRMFVREIPQLLKDLRSK